DAFPMAEQGRLEAGLGVLYLRLGDTKEAKRLLGQAANHRPDDLNLRTQLFDVVLLSGDDTTALKQIEETHRIEGGEGVFWRYQTAVRQVLAARKGNVNGLVEAQQQLAEVAKRRPGWGRVSALQAEIDELEGKFDQAITNYQKAIDR